MDRADDLTQLPAAQPVSARQIAGLAALLGGARAVALTGAGMSTGSGIPDYRGPEGTRRVQPMTHQDFLSSDDNRQRYWARSFVGWQLFNAAQPNVAHREVAMLEDVGTLTGVITQNVDGLHQQAGSQRVLELHGSLGRVLCLDCGCEQDRGWLQARMAALNPDFAGDSGQLRPDGDVALDEAKVAAFRPVPCPECDSPLLKPDVVFFGGNVPQSRVQAAYDWVDSADVLLVLGSSLQVMSGYRFVRRAWRAGTPVVAITRGHTRGDEQITLKVDALLQDALPSLTKALARAWSPTGASAHLP